MPSSPSSTRPEMLRTNSWPPAIRVAADNPADPRPRSGSMSATISQAKPSLEDDMEDHPEDYFLSSVYNHWDDSDSDDDGEEVEWDAGITDFALFDNDRRHAQETHDELPRRWDGLLAQQAAALRRSAERIRADAAADPRTGGLFTTNTTQEDLPELTPDSSPNLRDDLENVEIFHHQSAPRASVMGYMTVIVTPPSDDEKEEFDDGGSVFEDEDAEDSPPLSFFVERAEKRKAAFRKVERPGLRHSRTLSGKVHAWRRPSWGIYPVGEDPLAEEKAERE